MRFTVGAAGADPGEPVGEFVVFPVGEGWTKDFVDSTSDVRP
jgi:hypothetical protein